MVRLTYFSQLGSDLCIETLRFSNHPTRVSENYEATKTVGYLQFNGVLLTVWQWKKPYTNPTIVWNVYGFAFIFPPHCLDYESAIIVRSITFLSVLQKRRMDKPLINTSRETYQWAGLMLIRRRTSSIQIYLNEHYSLTF